MSRAGHYGPPDEWQMRHAFRFLAGYPGLQQPGSVAGGHAFN